MGNCVICAHIETKLLKWMRNGSQKLYIFRRNRPAHLRAHLWNLKTTSEWVIRYAERIRNVTTIRNRLQRIKVICNVHVDDPAKFPVSSSIIIVIFLGITPATTAVRAVTMTSGWLLDPPRTRVPAAHSAQLAVLCLAMALYFWPSS